MLFEFQSAEQIASDFQLDIFFWVGLLLLVRVVINFPFSQDLKKLLQQKKQYQPPFTFASAIMLGLLILILVLIITFFSYTSSFGRFSSLHAIPTRGISITYFELYPRKERQEFVPIENIKSIEYGQRGKEHDGASSCFIRIVTMAGPNHRSAYRHMSRSQCHNVQIHVVGTLCQPDNLPLTPADITKGINLVSAVNKNRHQHGIYSLAVKTSKSIEWPLEVVAAVGADVAAPTSTL